MPAKPIKTAVLRQELVKPRLTYLSIGLLTGSPITDTVGEPAS